MIDLLNLVWIGFGVATSRIDLIRAVRYMVFRRETRLALLSLKAPTNKAEASVTACSPQSRQVTLFLTIQMAICRVSHREMKLALLSLKAPTNKAEASVTACSPQSRLVNLAVCAN